MKYVQPYGISDPDAHYINGDPSIARQGSIPPADAFEHPMREIDAVIKKSMIVASAADLQQMAKAIRSQRMNYAADTGSVNNISVAFDPPLTAYTVGLPLRILVLSTNTGATTINAGAGVVNLTHVDGTPLAANDLRAGGLAEAVFDGTKFQLINFGGGPGGGGPVTVNMNSIPYAVDSSVTRNLVTTVFSPAITSLVAGTIIAVKIANTNNAPSTITVNGLAAKKLKANSGGELLPGDISVGDIVIMIYDGTDFYLPPNNSMGISATINVPSTQFPTMASVWTQFSRKRIPPNITLTVQMGAGIFAPILSYHTDADRIIINGTMAAAAPNFANFFHTGSSAGARATDSANNIAMLRTRFSTEIQFANTAGAYGIQHTGPGKPVYQNILITGANVFAGSLYNGMGGVIAGKNCQIDCINVCVWGSGSFGFVNVGGTIGTNNCFAVGNWTDGYFNTLAARLGSFASGAYGNAWAGYECANSSSMTCDTCQSDFNGTFGAQVGASSSCSWSNSASTGNGVADGQADKASIIGLYLSTMPVTSPALGVEGNFSSIIYVLA